MYVILWYVYVCMEGKIMSKVGFEPATSLLHDPTKNTVHSWVNNLIGS
jgi:hypothetical protein